MKQNINIYARVMRSILCLSIILLFNGCEDQFKYLLPDANSIEDTVFPSANFSYASSVDDFRAISFTNLSTEAITYAWDFGGGNTSNEEDPSFTFDAEGTYPVTLTASDGNGVTGTTTIEVMVVEGPFQPVIIEPGFEDNALPDGSGDGRDSWRKSELGGVIQITGSPVTFGSQGAKLPNDQSRVGYQEITVEPNTNYDLRFWYTMTAEPADPWLTVSIVGVTQGGGTIETPEAAADATIAATTVTDISDPETYIEQQLSFNSGENNTIAIYFFNGPVECRLDNFTIDIGAEGAVPPSVGFDVGQSEENFLEYTFTNTSKDATTYEWDFGDGNTSTDESPTHIYAEAGEYTVTLISSNDVGLSSELSKTFTILAPVTADFTFEEDAEDYQTIHFMDASVGAEMLLWEFGDGYQFTGMNPEHTYMEDGIYTVKLTAYSITGNSDVAEMEVTVSQTFIASIRESGFEDNDPSAAECGEGLDGRDCWRNSALGGVIQITSGPVVSGSQAAKMPSDGSRIGYQLIDVEPNRQYAVTFNYTMKTDAEGSLTVSILDGSTLNDISEVEAATLASMTVNDQTDADAYVQETLVFESGENSQVAVFFSNVGVECRLDDFSIEASEVFMPTIGEAGFEDNSLPDGTGDGRDSWRNDLGGVIQITSGPVVSGSQAAKLPSDGSRVGYQLIEVEANTDYRVTFNYTMKTDAAGSLTVSILDGSTLTDLTQVDGATIVSTTVNDQTDSEAYVMENLEFNSGSNTMIAIFFSNEGVECRLDDFSINGI